MPRGKPPMMMQNTKFMKPTIGSELRKNQVNEQARDHSREFRRRADDKFKEEHTF